MILTSLKAILGIVVILGGWILVQQAWRRVFPGTTPGDDVLADRIGCHQCPGPCDSPCEFADSDSSQATNFSNPATHPKGS